MSVTIYKHTTYPLDTLIAEIRRGEIALPAIQRPFVWDAKKVRDLLDSMYKGFPVGYLLFWSTGAEAGSRHIGAREKEAPPRLLVVDGQQRLTGLYAVMTGELIVREDFSRAPIRIPFKPDTETFEVTDAAIERNPSFISDISVLWTSESVWKVIRAFFSRLEESKGLLKEDQKDRLWDAIDRLFTLRHYPFNVLELSAEVDEESLADIFVRVNSAGVALEQADFILTLMSVWWEEGRKALEDFSRAAQGGSWGSSSPANPIIHPLPTELLRVGVGLAFDRARLSYIYQLLRGRDLETGEISPEARERQFELLRDAQAAVLDLTNWHEFLKAIRQAGYLSRTMITSTNNLLIAYLLYLIGLRKHRVDRKTLRHVISRWYFMSAMTGHFTWSMETRLEALLRRLKGQRTPEHFISTLDGIIETVLTPDYWEIRFPAAIESTSRYSAPLFLHTLLA